MRFTLICDEPFYFYDFIVQSAEALLSVDARWYWFVGDDAVLHPRFREETMLSELGATSETDCVLCLPVLGSDSWIRRIGGSIQEAEARLEKSLGGSFPTAHPPCVAPEAGAVRNRKVAVACADFLGLSRACLTNILEPWRRCALERIYVEAAVPNTLLGVARSPLFVHDFIWDGTVKAANWEEMLRRLVASPTAIFAHPIKLSVVPETALDRLHTAGRKETA